MKGTAIVGNKELPRVLYIVPWKSAEQVELEALPMPSVLNQSLQPVDPSTHELQVRFYHQLYPQNETIK